MPTQRGNLPNPGLLAAAGGEEIYAEVRKDKTSSTATPTSSEQPLLHTTGDEYELQPPEVCDQLSEM